MENPRPPLKNRLLRIALVCGSILGTALSATAAARNPLLYADVPDISIVRVGDAYYMSSTTMHMAPGLPIMKSDDLVNWRTVSYAYDRLEETDELNLANGKNEYSRGTWASSLRYHNGVFYVSTFCNTTGKTYVYSTKDPEKGPWKAQSFKPMMYDHSLFFDDDGRVYMVNGGGKIRLTELQADVSGPMPGGINQVIIENATAVAGPNPGLPAEGNQLFKVAGKYYLFNITWPKGGMRTVIIHRADKITGPYEGRVALQDKGVAQGGLISTPQGDWYAYLFRDYGAVGRIPYLVPVTWKDGWPEIGVAGKVPDSLEKLPDKRPLIPGIVESDEFSRAEGALALPLAWQWNHHPDNSLWSLAERPGFLRLKTGRVDSEFTQARNTLTQRILGPACSGSISLDASGLKDGDFAGLAMLQKRYGLVGVKREGDARYLVMVSAQSEQARELARIPLTQDSVRLRIDCDALNKADKARFYYSLGDGEWRELGEPLKMAYTIPHFMGYRFGLFNFSTKTPGGHADFDYFRILDRIPAMSDR